MQTSSFVKLLSAIAVAGLSSPAAAATIEGTWRASPNAEISVSPCGADYCGTLSWIVVPAEHSADCDADPQKFASEMLDYQNPDPTLRSRSLIGVQMMTLKPTADASRYNVHIYNSEDGKSYDGLAVVDGDTLNLQNCMGVCFTVQSWPRVPTRPGPAGFSCGG